MCKGGIHPAALVFHFLKDAFCFPLKSRYVHGRIIVVGNKRSCR